MADKTPKNNTPCRRLGLRRSIQKNVPTHSAKLNPNNFEDTPSASHTSLLHQCVNTKINFPLATMVLLNYIFPNSQVQIKSTLLQTPKSNETLFQTTTPNRNAEITIHRTDEPSKNHTNPSDELILSTPSQRGPPIVKSNSTGNTRYRLSLNRKIREKFTKKKLDFIAKTEATDECDGGCRQPEIDDLQSQINVEKEKIASALRRNKEIEQLKAVTERWQIGFGEALHRLRQQYNPPPTVQCILKSLNIPLDFVNMI